MITADQGRSWCQGRGSDSRTSTSKLSNPDSEALFQAPYELLTTTELTRTSYHVLLPSSASMASRVLLPNFRLHSSRALSSPFRLPSHSFQTSTRQFQEVVQPTVAVRKPVGAFRGGYVSPLHTLTLLKPQIEHFHRPILHLTRACPDTPFIRLFGFLLGSTLAGASVYYYILEEYKISNEMLTEDIYVCASGLASCKHLSPFSPPRRKSPTARLELCAPLVF
jgi:hypothetical protein